MQQRWLAVILGKDYWISKFQSIWIKFSFNQSIAEVIALLLWADEFYSRWYLKEWRQNWTLACAYVSRPYGLQLPKRKTWEQEQRGERGERALEHWSIGALEHWSIGPLEHSGEANDLRSIRLHYHFSGRHYPPADRLLGGNNVIIVPSNFIGQTLGIVKIWAVDYDYDPFISRIIAGHCSCWLWWAID